MNKDTITKPDSLGLSYRISADGNIDIASYTKPETKRNKLQEEIQHKEIRCKLAANLINQGKHFKATEDKDLCCVKITVPNWDDLEIDIAPDLEPSESIDGMYWTDAWKLWIGDDQIGTTMSLPAVIAAIHRWIVERDLDDETRLIFDSYSNV